MPKYIDVEKCCSDMDSAIGEHVQDVVTVVRCRECKHRTKYGSFGHPRHEDTLPIAYQNDFCSYGERKEDADNG